MGKRAAIYFAAISINAIFVSVLSIIGSFFIRDLFDLASIGTTKGLHLLLIKNVLLGGLTIVITVITIVTYNNEAKRAIANLNRIMYIKSVKLPMAYYETHHTGDFMSKLIYDAGRTEDIFGSRLRRIITPVIIVIVCLIPMFYLCPQVTIGLLIVNCISLAVNTLMVTPMKKVSTQMSNTNKKMTENLTNILQGVEMIKIFAAKDRILKKYNASNQECSMAEKKKNGYSALLSALNTAFNLLCTLVFLGLGVYYIEKGVVGVGSLTALYTLYGIFSWHFLQIGRYVPELVNCLINAKRVFEFLDLEEEPETYKEGREEREGSADNKLVKGYASRKEENKLDKADSKLHKKKYNLDEEVYETAKKNLSTRPYVSMEHISFGYPTSEELVLNDFSLSVEKGTSVAITGHSGRGKSTLAKLLLGFYPAHKGQIYIDGVSLQELGLHKLRQLIAYVPQEPYLYNVSIAANISYGRPDATMEDIIEAAKGANAHAFIMKLSEGYDTFVGERGAKLSGGEKQRIAIARAILKNAPILLLDEATSALDNESEYLVQEAIGQLMKERTTIMIAHRPSTIASADVKVAM